MSALQDWITPSAAVAELGIPIESIAMYMQAGQFKTSVICGQLVVHRAEVAALALAMRAGLCGEGCE